MIEAMACGVPVVAYRGGSVAEVIDHGVTGFVRLSRRECRSVFERRFSVTRMAADYEGLYEGLVASRNSDVTMATGAA